MFYSIVRSSATSFGRDERMVRAKRCATSEALWANLLVCIYTYAYNFIGFDIAVGLA